MIGIVLGTGPSLTECIPDIERLREKGAILFAVNNTFQTFDLKPTDHWIACDPKWHEMYSPVDGDFVKWHWNKEICERFAYRHIEGRWYNGLSTDKSWISYNHCSSAQALNLAAHRACDPVLLAGHDFRYEPGKPRHYFAGLSGEDGEYPVSLRKYSEFDKGGDDLMEVYRHIAAQQDLPEIINCTPGSALKHFPMGELKDFL